MEVHGNGTDIDMRYGRIHHTYRRKHTIQNANGFLCNWLSCFGLSSGEETIFIWLRIWLCLQLLKAIYYVHMNVYFVHAQKHKIKSRRTTTTTTTEPKHTTKGKRATFATHKCEVREWAALTRSRRHQFRKNTEMNDIAFAVLANTQNA